MLNQEQRDNLERLIDQQGLAAVTDAMADICAAKVDHLLHYWQDERLACVWENAYNRLVKLTDYLSD